MVDVKGMLSLYEAAHVRFHGEDVLEKALIFTTTNLTSMMKSSTFTCSPIGRQVQHSLEQPFHKGIPRLEARRFISFIKKMMRRGMILWWKKLDFALKLPFARDRLVECYFWIVGTYFEPSYALARLFLTKVIVLTSVVDDIYDSYGTIDELKLFTDAFERWDSSCVNQLPGYMKVCYQTILDEYDEMDAVMNKEECSYHFEQRRGHVASAVECFMKEYGASKQEACNEINKMVEEAWKDVNEGCLTRSTVIPRPLLMAILNLTRMVLVVYKYEEDTYTHSDTRMKENVAILFIDPIDP
ncbi:hypothetical protein Sjap_008223 [Stephania japonica]|uniref:Sesquiterpene synthase n=1 Tax=Stephania japonica TaxID=461633 RepID=A0AAP0JPR3_9MAGN